MKRRESNMRKYLIEGSCDGQLFAETIEASSDEQAEQMAVARLCKAWGEFHGPQTTLDDLGDSASVREYEAADYAADAAPDLLAFVEQVGRMQTTVEADGADLGNDEAMNGLIQKARTLAAAARGEI